MPRGVYNHYKIRGRKRPPFSKEWREKIRKALWKGGKYKSNGRWFIYKPNHPFCNYNNYILRSRLVAEKCLGRYLEKGDIVHHINGKTDDDRPKNLHLFYSNSEHSHYEGLKKKPKLLSNLVIHS